MTDQQTQNNLLDDLDEVLVKEPDGTFRVVKVSSSPLDGNTPSAPKPIVQNSPSIARPAPTPHVLQVEEEKELATFAEKAKTFAPQQIDAVESRVRRALQESGIVLQDTSLQSRLFSLLVAHAKEVRNSSETREILMRAREQGGVGMLPNDAARLLSLLTPQQRSPAPSQPIQAKPVPQKAPQPLTPSPVSSLKPAPSIPQRSAPITRPSPQPVTQEASRPLQDVKPRMQDVTFTPTLVGPVEELRTTLVDWRRMAPTLKDRGTKIEEKLRLLEEGSYAERVKGVASWYASEVVRLYQDVGRESLVSGKPVATILAERQGAGVPALSMEEFQSIAELNERLRF